jgi:1-acyl-sn-glycerol-3-phosphate acyltransferase
MKLISSFIFHKIFRWQIQGDFPQDEKKFIIIFAPHTHWVDFFMGLATKWIKGLKANYAAKSSLFKPPFGFIFRWFGGVPIERVPGGNKVDAIVQLFNSRDEFALAMSPEGTRQKVAQWKTGYYYIAKGADIPIVMVSLDFKNKVIRISKPHRTTENKDLDFQTFYKYFEGVEGKIQEYS